MKTETLKFQEITQKVIGCAMKVYRHFGMNFSEVIYNRALVVEIRKTGLQCFPEMVKDIYYDGILIGKRRLDIIVENNVLIELKAVSLLEKKYFNQVISYLKIFELEVGLLINFGKESLEFKRFINSKTSVKSI